MHKLLISILFSLLAVSCGAPRYVDYFPYHDDGTAKPKVALMPIVDSTSNSLPWSLTEEISNGLYYELMNSGEFYVVSPNEIGPGWQKRNSIDFFSNDTSYVEDFKCTDFIVAMEIIERSITPCDPCYPTNLTMTLRIRIKILDIRYCEPKIVLYEVFKTCYTGIQKTGSTGEGACWNEDGYSRSYCGMAHQRAISCLTKRLEEVIWSVK